MKKNTIPQIITLPNPKLRQVSTEVEKITPEILTIINQMKMAALDWEKNREHEVSTALTAVQIGVMKRIIIIREDFNDKDNQKFITLINPKIVKLEGKKLVDYEGCLSVTDVYAKVHRPDRVKIKAKNEEGEAFYLKANGFLSRIIQHEIDHMNGIMFVDLVKNKKDFYKLNDNGELVNLDYETGIKPLNILRD